MATPLTPQQLLDALKAEGITVTEYTGWRDRCRCHTGSHEKGIGPSGRLWGPINGVMVHHTAGDLGSRTVTQYIADILVNDPTTPNKVQLVVDPSGGVWIVSAGRSNHAGKISQSAFDKVIAGTLPLTGNATPSGTELDGNTHLYGIECIAAGVPNAAQRAAAVKICAAICRRYGWTGADVVGHGEASNQRSNAIGAAGDPGFDMGAFRRDVIARLQPAPPPPAPIPTPTPAPPPAAPTQPSVSLAPIAAAISAELVKQGFKVVP